MVAHNGAHLTPRGTDMANTNVERVVDGMRLSVWRMAHGYVDILADGRTLFPEGMLTLEQARFLLKALGEALEGDTQAPIIPGKAGTVDASDLHSLRMGNGEGKHDRVIDGGMVKMYVGFGWVDLRTADQADTDLYPVVVREKG